MNDNEITTTNITRTYKNELKKLARMWKKPQIRILEEIIFFFKMSKTNPATADSVNPKNEIQDLTKEVKKIIGFIITNEKTKIAPLLDELNILSRSVMKSLEDSTTKDDIKVVEENTKYIKEMLDRIIDLLKALVRHFDDGTTKVIDHVNKSISISMNNSAMLELIVEAITSKTITGGVNHTIIEKFNELKSPKL